MPSAKRLKVGLVFDDTLDSSDGVAQYVKTIGRYLSGQGHEVRYLVGESRTTEWADGKVYSLAKNIKVRFNGNKLSMPGLSRRRQIKKVLRDEDFDVLHIMVPYSPLMAARVINMAAKKTAIVGTFHIFPAGWLSRAGSKLLRLWLSRNIRKFDKMLAVSKASAQFARSAYKLDPVVVPNAVDVSSMSRPRVKKQKDIVFVGRLVDRKGCLYLLKAFKLLATELSDVNVTVVGAGAQDQTLKRYVKSNGLDGRVRFAGFVSEEEKAELLSGAAVACFPSLYGEAFGIVLIEAMAAGSGVVLGGDNPGYRSVLGEHEELLINPTDTAAFSQRLKTLLTDKQLAADLHAWQERSIKQYDVKIVGEHIESIYRSLIANKNKNEHN
ncbi:MAG TPA: glycosyltransferase family 4 protein [Candidatus Saccharimonadales bacterium]|nr:glycosyltransferase family 4 protein [Candidatus Saccharimonadales bacterium]